MNWLLLHHMNEHRFQSRQLPKLQWVAQDTWNSLHSLLWRFHGNRTQWPKPCVQKVRGSKVALAILQEVVTSILGFAILATFCWIYPLPTEAAHPHIQRIHMDYFALLSVSFLKSSLLHSLDTRLLSMFLFTLEYFPGVKK